MASIIEGFNYDIFISYRQKDNKYNGWVTEFVESLKKELETTFKEEISVYFDINPQDGLLETHDVDASLREKLKCLVFIPVISTTYCDTGSFAWTHEFRAFVKQASDDKFGLKVKLAGGNIASRVLPVRIHDLDDDDTRLCESVLGGVLRGIEFIYRESGVNRPLTPDDDIKTNLNKTRYRNQINKVALAVREILTSLKKDRHLSEGVSEKTVKSVTVTESIEEFEKSIAVLPFINDSPDQENTYFINGVMEEILNNLQRIKDLRVISRTSVEQYRGQGKPISEIAEELGVNYIVEGSGQRYGNSFRLRTQLIMAAKETHLWGESFQKNIKSAEDIFGIQTQIAETIATELKAVITPQEKQIIEKIPTVNLEAYEAYLKGQFYLNKFTPSDLDSAMQNFELAKELDPNYALAYTGICDVWAYRQQWGLVTPAEGNPKSMEAVMRAYALDSNNAVVLYTLAGKKTWGMFDWVEGESGFKKSISLNPNSAITHAAYSHLLNILGRPQEALEQIDIALKLDPMNPFITTFYGVDLYMARKYDEAIRAFKDALNLSPGYPFALTNLWHVYHATGLTEKAYATLKSFWAMVDPQAVKSLEQGYSKNGFRGALLSLAEALVELWTNSPNQFFAPVDIAMLYSFAEETDKAIYWLEQAYNFRDPNLPYLLLPTFDNIRNDSRFHDLCQRMNLPCKPML
jgi:TolB-like protein